MTTIDLDFKTIKVAVAKQFDKLVKNHTLYRTATPINDEVTDTATIHGLWDTYLASFPEGTNPIFRERTEHDCTCCKQFIRAIGNVVAVVDDKLVSVWDCTVAEPAYQVVVAAMAKLVKSNPIANPFLHFELNAGTDRSLVDGIEGVKSFQHFFANIPLRYVIRGTDIPTSLSKSRANFDVMKRGLTELTADAVQTVLEIISQNSLYRGEEFKPAVAGFAVMKAKFDKVKPELRDMWVWANLTPKGMIRNSAIGTLLISLSEGMGLEEAVKKFEGSVMAPMNYKRPTALVSKKMIEDAKVKITELGLGSALQRRYALIEDITVNNVLFVNRDTRTVMEGDVFDTLTSKVLNKMPKLDKVEDVSIEKFLKDILPKAESIELMVENRHTGNFMSLIAPADPTAKKLFKWDNQFSWSYNGEVADSIKERVKAAGGNVEGDLCCRLAWFNHDDLDLHMVEPNGNEISFHNKISSTTGGKLDVDMNAGYGTTRTPVENIFYANKSKMKEGEYHLFVHQWAKRETQDVGFEVELDFLGEVYRFSHADAINSQQRVSVIKFKYTKANGVEILSGLNNTKSASKGREVWNITTQAFMPVKMMMLSPNHWDEQGIGNRHFFFMLEGCRNETTARGFFNEFLSEELTPHRKVLELVGSKMRTDEQDYQLSGLGFSSTQRNNVLCRVKGSFSRVINLIF